MALDKLTGKGRRSTRMDIKRKFILKHCIDHLLATAEQCYWVTMTFRWNAVRIEDAKHDWDKFSKWLERSCPGIRAVGVWARQQRGAWHCHLVWDKFVDVVVLRSYAMANCRFGPFCNLVAVREAGCGHAKMKNYIANYAADKNGLDPVRDKGVRRLIFLGKNVRIVSMRWCSTFKLIVRYGRALAGERGDDLRKPATESWADWYVEHRESWFALAWAEMTPEERDYARDTDEMTRRYLDTGRWGYV